MTHDSAHPFSSYGPWNLPIGRGAVYSKAGVANGYVVGLSSWEQPNDWSIPVYAAKSSDPLLPVLYNIDAWNKVASGEWLRAGNSAAVEQQILNASSPVFPTGGNVFSSQSTTGWVLPQAFNHLQNPAGGGAAKFYFPAGANPAMGWDGHIAVHQPDGKVFEGYGAIRLSSGQVVALTYNVTDPKSNGDATQNGVTASMLPVYGGLTTEEEILSGHIDHAMKLYAPAAVLTPDFAYPALAFDRDAVRNSPAYSGEVPMGGRLALPANLDLTSLGLESAEGRTIAAAAKAHGFIVADRGGTGFSIMVEQNHKQTSLDSWSWYLDNDLKKIFSKLQLVDDESFDVAKPTPDVSRKGVVAAGHDFMGPAAVETLDGDGPGHTLIAGQARVALDVGTIRDGGTVGRGGGVTTLYSSVCKVKLPARVDNLKAEGDCSSRTLVGNELNNSIYPGDGNAEIVAGTGNDVVHLGAGNYVVRGGPGHDIFAFQSPIGRSLIADFHIGDDRLDLTGVLHAVGYSGRDPLKDGVLRFKREIDGKLAVVLDRDGSGPLQAHTLAVLDHFAAESLVANLDWFF